jgi:Rrf2 family transcriptional regulator, nitric oxide-sensitive transcriptional repressor
MMEDKMKLTTYTNYALRSLQLAALKAPNRIKVDDVVKVHGLARPHIVKIVHELGRAGYLETVRGRGGGFFLARPPEDIIIGDVVRLTEGPLDIVECFNPKKNTCPLIGICKLSKAMQKATKAFMDVLDDLTLADIASNKHELLARIAPLEEGIVAPMRLTQ